MAQTLPFKRVMWALDPFEGSQGARDAVEALLKQIVAKVPVDIEPVYVLNPGDLSLPTEFFPPALKMYRPATEGVMTSTVSALRVPGLQSPKVLVQRQPSIAQSVRTLLAYARSRGTDLIVLGTHARRGMTRFLLGSFAETLLLQSRQPVLVTHPGVEPAPIERILFPSDLGPHSRKMFKNVVNLARAFGAQVTLFHVTPHPVSPVLQSGAYLFGGGWVSVPDFMTQVEQKNRKLADGWAQEAKRRGVDVSIVFEGGQAGVRQAILDHASEGRTNLIAMAAQSGGLKSAVLGSFTRQVVRDAPCPVWVLRT